MAVAKGYPSITGVAPETTLGTPVQVTSKIPLISETMTSAYDQVADVSLVGSATQDAPAQGIQRTAGGILVTKRMTAQDPILTHFFGNFTQGLTNDPGGGAPFNDDHYLIQDDLDGEGLTLAFKKQVAVYEYTGFKGSTFTLTGTPTDGIRINLEGFATGIDLGSTTNTDLVLDALANTDVNIQLSDMELLIADTTGALASPGDRVKITQFTLELNRNLAALEVNSKFLEEAIEDSWRTSTFNFTIGRYDDTIGTQFRTWHDNHTFVQAQLTFTIGSSNYKIFLPKMLIANPGPANLSGAGAIPLEIETTLHTNRDNTNTQPIMTDIESEILWTELIV